MKRKSFKTESGQLLPPYELIRFFAFMQCSVSSKLVAFSENVRDKIRKKIIYFIYLFCLMRKRKKEGKEILEQCEVIHNFSFSLLLLLLSRFSHVRLCVTPEMAAHQAPPSLGFSRQEHWSELFPSPMHEREKWKWSRSVVSDS